MASFIYIIFGSCENITIGPTAIMATMVLPLVTNYGADIAILITFLKGCIIALLGLFHLGMFFIFSKIKKYRNLQIIYNREILLLHPFCFFFQGFLLDFISLPVITGFTSAAAINIASSQFKSLLGISGKAESFLDSLIAIFKHLDEFRYQDSVLGICTILVLVLLKV